MQKIIFTDLDGTLLDYKTYSYIKVSKVLKLINKNKIPLIFCSSKTRDEIEYYRKKLDNMHPFISENGGAIFIPNNYFNFKFNYNRKDKKYFIIEFGTDIEKLKKALNKLKKEIKIKSFFDMTTKEISIDAGLSLKKARLAKKREYDIPFKLIDKNKEKKLIKLLKNNKLNCTKSEKYYHIIGNNNKGKAVKTLITIYKKNFKNEKIMSYAFGDSKNDFEMLDAVNLGFLVKKYNNKYASKRYKMTDGLGSKGLNNKILSIIKNEI